MHGNPYKIIAACNVSKNAALPQVFSAIFIPFSKFLQSISQVTLYHTNSCMLLYIKLEMQILNLVVCGNADDTANVCQMMSFSRVEEDLNKNEHLK